MLKFIAIAVLIWLLFFLLRMNKTNEQKTNKSIKKNMVICCKCGVHVLEDEVIKKNAKFYCSKNCL